MWPFRNKEQKELKKARKFAAGQEKMAAKYEKYGPKRTDKFREEEYKKGIRPHPAKSSSRLEEHRHKAHRQINVANNPVEDNKIVRPVLKMHIGKEIEKKLEQIYKLVYRLEREPVKPKWLRFFNILFINRTDMMRIANGTAEVTPLSRAEDISRLPFTIGNLVEIIAKLEFLSHGLIKMYRQEPGEDFNNFEENIKTLHKLELISEETYMDLSLLAFVKDKLRNAWDIKEVVYVDVRTVIEIQKQANRAQKEEVKRLIGDKPRSQKEVEAIKAKVHKAVTEAMNREIKTWVKEKVLIEHKDEFKQIIYHSYQELLAAYVDLQGPFVERFYDLLKHRDFNEYTGKNFYYS